MEIKNKTVEEVAVEIQKLIDIINPDQPYGPDAIKADVDEKELQALIKLLHIRGQIIDKFKAVFNVVDTIEANVKAKKFPIGTYGMTNPLKVTPFATSVVDNVKLMDIIKSKFEVIDPYVIPNTKNKDVEEIIKNNPALVTKEKGSNRHSFK